MPIDIFISYASEDRDALARPLAEQLRNRGWSVWFDEFELVMGDSLRKSIDRGLAEAKFGLVILSPDFFAKQWPQRELDGLTTREQNNASKIILPVWHRVSATDVTKFSPPLADKRAVSSEKGVTAVVDEIERALGRKSTALPKDIPRWIEWAWDHGTPRDQERARELMGSGVLDPKWDSIGKEGSR
ncbi:MAG TPA: toll/interleukin-1 receptor domain-containing protein [Solirubrobacterales bacterium]